MKIGNKVLDVPMIQGGMGIGISMGNLAGHVAACGGMGVISTANTGFQSQNFVRNPVQTNRVALMQEIKKAQAIADGKGLIAVNAMVATTGFEVQVTQAIAAGADCIIAGAGLPVKLPELVVDSDIAIAPIVSSGKAINSLCRYWQRRYQRAPDFVILEGPEAGGHLGFSNEELRDPPSLSKLLADVLEALEPTQQQLGHIVPVFVAGGIKTPEEVSKYQKEGAIGVQLGTRFAATHECDASTAFKEMFVKYSAADCDIIKSPAGMPGRAIHTNLVTAIKKVGRIPPNHCVNCLHTCNPAKTHFCISRALAEAQRGNELEGLFFTGTSIDTIHEILSVEEVFDQFMPNWRALCQ